MAGAQYLIKVSRVESYKELSNSSHKRYSNPIVSGQGMNRQFTQKDTWVANKYTKSCSASLAFQEIRVSITKDSSVNKTIPRADKDAEEVELSLCCFDLECSNVAFQKIPW